MINFIKPFSRYFFKIGNPKDNHPAVLIEDVLWLDDFVKSHQPSISFEDALYMLRRKLFPFMHNPYPWVEGIAKLVL